jgi:hypothetical protein
MEIAEISETCELVTIQSINSFSPPFTTTAVVEGTISNGHTFVFAVSSAGATSGVSIIGNLNPDNCSDLGDCGNPATCGTPFNSSITAGECFYGIDVKTGSGGGGWKTGPKLYNTPAVDVLYTIQISVSVSGIATYSISQAGALLGKSTAAVGTGPLYIILEQAEGGPVSGEGDNEAYWDSVSMTGSPSGLTVYPTEPAFTYITLDYPQGDTSTIHVTVAKDPTFPQGLNVTLRPRGATKFNSALSIQPSSSGSSSIEVNATLNCAVGSCNKPGGTQLPLNYNLNITASDGTYSGKTQIPLQLLEAKWLVMWYCASGGSSKSDALQPNMEANLGLAVSASKAYVNPAVGILVLFYAYYSTSFPGNSVQPAGSIALYRVANGTITQVGSIWAQTNIYDPATLSKFLSTAMGLDPAARNQLILYDHGGGIQGFGYSSTTGMSITQLATALSGVSQKLDVLSFDACLMGQVEVLYQLSSYASYFTASELSIPGDGYNYGVFLTSLLQYPDQSTAAYLNVIVSSFGAKYANQVWSPSLGGSLGGKKIVATLAAINSSQLAGIVSGLGTLSSALVHDYGVLEKQQAQSGLDFDQTFNYSMFLVRHRTAAADVDDPYLDIRSLAQNILLNPDGGITDANVMTAATAVIQDVKAAVIANTTTNSAKMYEGLTVTMFNGTILSDRGASRFYRYYIGLEATSTFSSVANWTPLLYAVSRSVTSQSVTIVQLQHPGHQLYLNVYNSTGGRTGFNPALLNGSSTAIEVIPGSYYLDFGNGTTLIALPSSVQNFTVVVDGTSMEEANESYTLTYTYVQNGTVTSTKTVEGTIDQNTLQSAAVSIQSGVLAVGAMTITTPTISTTSSASSTTSSAALTTSSSSTSSASKSSLTTTYALAATLVAVVIAVELAISARRRRELPAVD